MRITNNGVTQSPVNAALPVPVAAAGKGDGGAEAVGQEADAYTPSADWLRTLNGVQQQPEIREDRVQAAIDRLQSGAYFSQQSAGETADAILRSLD